MLTRILALIRKEIRHILRDLRSLGIVFVLPVIMVVLFGYALNMDVRHIPLGIVDHDRTPESRALVEALCVSEYFDGVRFPDRTGEVEALFKNRVIKAAVVIPKGYSGDRLSPHPRDVQVLIDGSDPTIGNAVDNYTNAVFVSVQSTFRSVRVPSPPVDVRPQFLYNQDLRGSHFIIPGLVAVILMMVCALLTSITIAREKETGTMDVLLVSPVRPLEIIVGKVIPYIGLAFLDAAFILMFAKIVFDIPVRGNLMLLVGLTVPFIYCALGIGLFISSFASTQQVAMMAALVSTILPSVILSGFIFPIFSMPAPIRALTHIIPAKYYIVIIRGILLKSSSFSVLRDETLFLCVLGTVFVIIATMRFRTRVKQ